MTTRDFLDDMRQGAESTVETVTEAASGTRTNVLDLVAKVGKLLAAIPTPTAEGLLSRLGLRRQRTSILESAATFGAGFIAGGIAGVLLAPKSGQEMRNDLARRLDELLGKGRDLKSEIANDAEAARGKVDEVSSEAKAKITNTATAAKSKVIDAAASAKEATKEAVERTKEAIQGSTPKPANGVHR